MEILSDRDVIESDERQILWDSDATLAQGVETAKGHHVARRKDRCKSLAAA
jgi:hypothetical protein